GHLNGDDGIALFHAHRDDAAHARVAERRQLGLLDNALPRAHDDELVLFELLHRHHRGDLFAFFHRDEIGDRFALAAGAHVGNLVHLQPVGAAAVRENHDVGVSRRDEEMADEILVARPHADASLAAAALVAIRRDCRPLDVAGVAHRDRHVFLGDQILDGDLARLALDDLRASFVPVRFAHRLQFVDDDLHQQTVARQNRAQLLDRLQQIGELVDDLLPLQPGQALQLHVEDRLRLDLCELELRHQAVARFGRRLRSPDQLDHGVEMIEGDLQALEDVVPRLGLLQIELGAPPHDFPAEVHEALDHLEQIHDLRPPADDGEHDDAEAHLQLRVLVEVVENHLGHFAPPQLDDDPHALAVRLVTQIRDALDLLVAHELRDAFDQLRLVDLIRDFGDDDRLLVSLAVGLDHRPRAHEDRSAPRRVRLDCALLTDDQPGGRKIGRRNQADQVPQLLRAVQVLG